MSDSLIEQNQDRESALESPNSGAEDPPIEVSSSDFLAQVGKQGRADRKRQERRMLLVTASVVLLFVFLGWLTDGRIFTSPWKFVISFEADGNASRDPAINCQHPRNKGTPYCVERKARTGENWNGIVRNTDGKASQFNLH